MANHTKKRSRKTLRARICSLKEMALRCPQGRTFDDLYYIHRTALGASKPLSWD